MSGAIVPGILFALCATYIVWLAVGYPRVIRTLAAGKILPAGGALPAITIVVPAYNEERNIAAKMDDLEKQEYPPELRTIVVVDNGSTDRTAEIAEMCNAIVLNAPRGKISAINTACAQCDTDIIVVTDADTTLAPDAIRHLVGPLSDAAIAAVGGWVEVHGDPTWWSPSKLSYHQLDWELRTAEGLVDTAISLDGKLMAWRLSDLAGLPKRATVDDLLIPLLLRKQGLRSVIAREAVVHEQGASTWQGELRQIRRRAAISLPPIGQHMGLMFDAQAGWYGRLIFPSRRFMAVFMPFMLLYCWGYVLALSPPLWLLCTAAGIALIVWKRLYFPLLQQLGIVLAWSDFLRDNVAPGATWETGP